MGAHPGRRTTPERDQLIEDYLPLARKLACRYVGRGEPLDDLVQVGALGLLRASERFDADRGVSFGTFAAVVIDGEIRRHLRASANERVVGPDAPVDGPFDAEPLAASDARAFVSGPLQTLDERERRVVLLRFHADMTERQIASLLRISQAHVSRVLGQALEKLRAELSEPGDASFAGDIAAPRVISPIYTRTKDPRPGGTTASEVRTTQRRRAVARRRQSVSAKPGGYSGRFLVRMPGELHEELARCAQEANISLNRLVTDVLAASTSSARPEPPPRVEQPEAAPGPQSEIAPPSPRTTRALRLAIAANVCLVLVTGAIAVIVLVAALHRGI